MLEAGLVESRPDLVDELGGDPATLRRRIEPDAVEPVAERVRHAKGLLGLVLERVDQDDPWHVRRHVPVEREGRLDGVAEDQHQRMGHRAGRREPGQTRAGRRRGADAAADDRGVVEDVGDVRVDVPRPEADDRLRRRDVDARPGRGRPAGRLGEHPEERRLVQPEPPIAGADAEDDLLRLDHVAVVERLELGLGGIGAGQHVAEQVARLVDPAQDGVLAGEDLHRDQRIETLLLEDALGTREIDVSRVARQDLVRRPRARQTHQSGSAPLPPSSPTSTGRAGSGEAASVAYGSGVARSFAVAGADGSTAVVGTSAHGAA